MALREKTSRKFKDFFAEQSEKYDGKEFEISFSEIRRETGTAGSTMKRAIEALAGEGWLGVKAGRNSRYGLFKILDGEVATAEPLPEEPEPPVLEAAQDVTAVLANESRIQELEYFLDGLRRRLRAQEVTIALLQDRMAELEDRLQKR